MVIEIFQILLSCIVIWRASDGFEAASAFLGRNLSDGVRGATINAIGSSMPELFTTMWFLFALKDTDGFASGIATTAGSAIFNGMIIPSVVILAVIFKGIVKRVKVSKKVIWRDGISLIVANLVLIFLLSGNQLYWWHGLILILTYGAYIILVLKTMKASELELSTYESDDFVKKSKFKSTVKLDLEGALIRKPIGTLNATLLLIVSMIVIGGACALLVASCEGLAHSMGIATYFVAVIIASAATSIPDTVLSYKDALNGQYDDAVANALGSNIFDVCFALGFPMLVFCLIHGPIVMSQESLDNVTELRVLLLLLTVVGFLIFVIKDGLGWFKGVMLFLIYILFAGFIFAQAYEVSWAIELGAYFRSFLD